MFKNKCILLKTKKSGTQTIPASSIKATGQQSNFCFTLRKYFHNLFLPKKNAYFRCQLWRVEHTIDEYND